MKHLVISQHNINKILENLPCEIFNSKNTTQKQKKFLLFITKTYPNISILNASKVWNLLK